MDADEAHRDRDLFRADFALHHLEHAQCDLFGVLDFRAGRRAQPQRDLAGIRLRKNLNSEPSADEPGEKKSAREIGWYKDPACRNDGAEKAGVGAMFG